MTEKRNTQPTVLSLFSGVGGFDLGLETAGMRTVYQCEIDRHARAVLEAHWPDVPRHDDITTLTGDQVVAACSEIDVVAWGSPCQDLSVAGKRAGLAGSRSSLFHEGMRVISEIRKATNGLYPRISIWENVAGALTSNDGHDFGLIINTMAEMGAVVIEWAVLDAQHFGVPQRRRRVFVVAVFDSATAERCTEPILPVGESVSRDFAAGTKKGQNITREVATGFGNSGFERWTETLLIAFSHTQGLDAQPSEHHWPTLRVGGAGHAVATDMVVRRLTPIECERLMGWPDDHTRWRSDSSEQSDNQRYKQCGNGVAAPVASWVGSQIIRIFSAGTLENEPQHKGNT